jgi:histidinol-phosphate aminotransferase
MKIEVAEHIASLKPYVPGKPLEELERELGITGAIKLASNENPLGPSPKAIEAIQGALPTLQLYPDGAAFKLREKVAEHVGANFEEIATGNGSNELLTLIARTFCVPGDHAVISDYSFIAYRVIMGAEGMRWDSVPTKGDFETDIDGMLARVTDETRVLFLANPNNPTGTYTKEGDLRRLLEQTPEHVIVVVDEAYHEYVQAPDYTSALELRDLRERLVVCRTFSKIYGLGGLRAGFAVAPAEMMDYLHRVREPFNCNALAQFGATAALDDVDFVKRSVAVNEAGRAIMTEGLNALADQGVSFTPSQTNFLLVHFADHDAREIYDRMLREGVIVRPMAGYGLSDSLRITIGDEEQCQRCLSALSAALK